MSQQPDVFQTVASRPPPRPVGGLLPWIQRNLLDGWTNVLITVLLIALLALAVPPIVQWGLLNAVFGPDNAACRAAAAGQDGPVGDDDGLGAALASRDGDGDRQGQAAKGQGGCDQG